MIISFRPHCLHQCQNLVRRWSTYGTFQLRLHPEVLVGASKRPPGSVGSHIFHGDARRGQTPVPTRTLHPQPAQHRQLHQVVLGPRLHDRRGGETCPRALRGVGHQRVRDQARGVGENQGAFQGELNSKTPSYQFQRNMKNQAKHISAFIQTNL